MIITTTNCGQFGHPEFVLEADQATVPEIYLKELAQTIEAMVAEGSQFRPGETFQIGWMLTKVQAHGSSQLTLEEPDMESFPIRWVPGVSHTLRQQMLQAFMLDSVSLRHEMQIPTILNTLLSCTRYTAREFFMVRAEATNERDSGWFVGCVGQDHDHNDAANLRCISLYEAYLGQKGIQGFLAFPMGSMVVVEPEHGVSILKDDNELDILPDSFLGAWLRRRGEGSTAERLPE